MRNISLDEKIKKVFPEESINKVKENCNPEQIVN